jgi:hypothetical protein
LTSFGKRRAIAASGWSCTEPGCTAGARTASTDSANTSGLPRARQRDYAELKGRDLRLMSSPALGVAPVGGGHERRAR